METKRQLKKIGGSVALFIPPEMLEELQLEPGAEVEVVSEGDSIRVRRPNRVCRTARSSSPTASQKSMRRRWGTSPKGSGCDRL